MRIVFFGTSSFAAQTLRFLREKGVEIVAIVTRPDRPRGRCGTPLPPPVKEVALAECPGIPLLQPEKISTPEGEVLLRSFCPDLFVVVAYGEIIKKHLLDLPTFGAINVHASLLPKYRGAAPMQRALMDGVRETGITIIQMTPQMDAGDILGVESLPVPREMTLGELEPKLCALGCTRLLQVLGELQSGTVVRTPQDPSQVTFAPKMTPEEGKILWNMPADVIYNLVRALSPSPGAWGTLAVGGHSKRLKIKAACPHLHLLGEPGVNLKFDSEGWLVGCGSGVLELKEVQLEGRKAMPIQEFVCGHPPSAVPSFSFT